jgi:general secretion pathway protein L
MADRELTLPSYGARLRGLARRSGVAGFFAWWTREIAAVMPAAPLAALERRRMRPVVVFASDHATLWRPAMEDGKPVMRAGAAIALGGDAAASAAEGRSAIATLAAPGAGAPRVAISLSPQDVLRKRIVLPAAVEENLAQVLAYDLDRHTPFKPEELYFDAAVVDRSPARGTVTVDLAAVRCPVVDVALRHVASWGAEVSAVVPEPPERAGRSRLNLLPPEARTSASALLRWQFWVPALLLLAMAAAAVAIPLWQKRDYVLQLAAQADQARGRAAVSETLRTELNARVADYNFALERKYAFPGSLAVVDTVSKVLPDDTWLTQFELKSMAKGKEVQRELALRGETSNAGRLVQLFEESQMFTQAAQRGPTTKIQPGPGEIFDLGAQLKQRASPPQLALTVSDAAPAPAAAAPAVATPPPAAPAPPPAAAPAPSAPAAAAPQPTSSAPSKTSAPPPPAPAAASPQGAAAPAAAPAVPTQPAAGSAPPMPATAPPVPPPSPAIESNDVGRSNLLRGRQ